MLPAAEEAECIWTKKFGFKKITPDQVCLLAFSCAYCFACAFLFAIDIELILVFLVMQLSEYRKSFYQMISFQGTCMLEKGVPEWRRIIHQK